MKIKELRLRNYKRFVEPTTISFCNADGEVNDMTLLVGSNGTGKSSILQAIAMLVGSAVRPNFKPDDLDYPGFAYEYIQAGSAPLDVRATIQLTNDEIDATREFSNELASRYPERTYYPPDSEREIEIWLDYDTRAIKSARATRLFQLKGYQYALQLSPFRPDFTALLDRVGSVYLQHEQRTSASFTAYSKDNGEHAIKIDDNYLRRLLSSWALFHERVIDTNPQRKIILREGQRDRYAELEKWYSYIFKGRKLKGPAPRMMPNQILDEPDFWLLGPDGRDYELGAMSAGERAIFPLLIDFANWRIDNSIILIDELELHLHPPLQQALVRMLPMLGKNNQFIITTHSDDVAALFLNHQIKRAPSWQ